MTIEEFSFWFVGFIEGNRLRRPTREQWAHVIQQIKHIEPRDARLTYAIKLETQAP